MCVCSFSYRYIYIYKKKKIKKKTSLEENVRLLESWCLSFTILWNVKQTKVLKGAEIQEKAVCTFRPVWVSRGWGVGGGVGGWSVVQKSNSYPRPPAEGAGLSGQEAAMRERGLFNRFRWPSRRTWGSGVSSRCRTAPCFHLKEKRESWSLDSVLPKWTLNIK